MRRLIIAATCLGIVFSIAEPLSADAKKAQPCAIPGYSADQCSATATAMSHNVSVYGRRQVYVAYVNLFHYQFSPQVNSSSIAGASVPGALGPSVSSGAAAAANLNPPAQAPGRQPAPTPAVPTNSCSADALNAGDASAVQTCWQLLEQQLQSHITSVADIRKEINQTIRSVADEQHCYIVRTRDFSQPLLTQLQATELIDFAENNGGNGSLACDHSNNAAEQWPSDKADTAWTELVGIQTALNTMQTAPGFQSWATAHQAAYNSASTLTTSLIAEAAGYATRVSPSNGTTVNIGQSFADFQNAVDSNQVYRDTLRAIATAARDVQTNGKPRESVLIMTIPLNPCAEWYGRGRTDTISLQYTDVTVTPNGSPASISIGTNTCQPMSIASSGIGVSFLPNPTFNFVPADNTGAQVIGETARNDKSPLYAVFYNVKLSSEKGGVGLFASPGVGFTSSSNATTTDLLAGLSLSLARRLLFVTPAADIGRRDQLLPGFTLTTPKGSLTSVPTQSHWAVNFMISVSFGIGPS